MGETLFLDPGLRIKRFTPKLADLFSIAPSDVGRSITDFAHQLDYDGLADDARAVLDDLAPVGREIRSRDGGWYIVRFRPYRTIDDKIDGVVAGVQRLVEKADTPMRAGELSDADEGDSAKQRKGADGEIAGQLQQSCDRPDDSCDVVHANPPFTVFHHWAMAGSWASHCRDF